MYASDWHSRIADSIMPEIISAHINISIFMIAEIRIWQIWSKKIGDIRTNHERNKWQVFDQY